MQLGLDVAALELYIAEGGVTGEHAFRRQVWWWSSERSPVLSGAVLKSSTYSLSCYPSRRCLTPLVVLLWSGTSNTHTYLGLLQRFSSVVMSKYKLEPCGLPAKDYTRSFWLSEPTALQNHRSGPELPDSADVIVIGSGISGTLMAYNLLEKQPNLRIVMVEAREVCGGATGRNGGQIKTDVSERCVPR